MKKHFAKEQTNSTIGQPNVHSNAESTENEKNAGRDSGSTIPFKNYREPTPSNFSSPCMLSEIEDNPDLFNTEY